MYYSITYLLILKHFSGALSIGSIDSSKPVYSQYSTSILGIIFAIIAFILFVYVSKILRLYTNYFIYIF